MSEQNVEPQAPAEQNEGDLQEATPEAPQAAEPKPVEVTPADQSGVKNDTVLGKDYEVSAERGYRQAQQSQPAQDSDDES